MCVRVCVVESVLSGGGVWPEKGAVLFLKKEKNELCFDNIVRSRFVRYFILKKTIIVSMALITLTLTRNPTHVKMGFEKEKKCY